MSCLGGWKQRNGRSPREQKGHPTISSVAHKIWRVYRRRSGFCLYLDTITAYYFLTSRSQAQAVRVYVYKITCNQKPRSGDRAIRFGAAP
jgi:predicted LPLAT superfamily acyltransferase